MNSKRVVLFLFVSLLVTLFTTIDSCEIYKFAASEDQALEGHVIKTIVHSLVHLCWNDCVWLSWCLSINVRPTNHGTVECDLNNSSRTANPGKVIFTQGSQYHEMKDVDDRYCKLKECKRKEDLGEGWFRYGKAAIKFFQQLKNWTDARVFCQGLGGDLVSITSSHENDFVYDVFVKELNLTYGEREMIPNFPGDVYWKFNGHDPGISFHGTPGGVSYRSVDGENALYFSGNGGYAKTDAVQFNLEGFTISLWLKNLNMTEAFVGVFKGLLSPSGSEDSFSIYINTGLGNRIFFKVSSAGMDKGIDRCSENVWCHFTFIWNKTQTSYGRLMDGKTFKSDPAASLNIITSEFVFGDRFKDFHAYIKHIMIFNRSLSINEAQTAMYWHEQGVWIGLNDRANTNSFHWSDGTPTSQFMPLPDYAPQPVLSGRKCVSMTRNRWWLDKHCLEKKPFLCERPAP